MNMPLLLTSIGKALLSFMLINLAAFFIYLAFNNFGAGENFTAGWSQGAFTYNGKRLGLELVSFVGMAFVLLGTGIFYWRGELKNRVEY